MFLLSFLPGWRGALGRRDGCHSSIFVTQSLARRAKSSFFGDPGPRCFCFPTVALWEETKTIQGRTKLTTAGGSHGAAPSLPLAKAEAVGRGSFTVENRRLGQGGCKQNTGRESLM
jgi:hypothetical protein